MLDKESARQAVEETYKTALVSEFPSSPSNDGLAKALGSAASALVAQVAAASVDVKAAVMTDGVGRAKGGEATITTGNTQVQVSFAEDMPDANYLILIQKNQNGAEPWPNRKVAGEFYINVPAAVAGDETFSWLAFYVGGHGSADGSATLT